MNVKSVMAKKILLTNKNKKKRDNFILAEEKL